jgi:hypothetical protein
MSEAKFTKGPWVANGMSIMYPDADGVYVMPVAHVSRMNYADGDSSLIACAPEMYAMLDKLSSQLTDINAHAAVNEIEALLAKSRGEA